MPLAERIDQDIKSAMLQQNKEALIPLRAIKAAVLLAKSSKDVSSGVLSPEMEISLIQKLIRQKKDAADIYQQQGREDLLQEELSQIKVFEQYLPEQLSENEIKSQLSDLLKEHNLTEVKDFGRAMGLAAKHFSGKADNATISGCLRALMGMQ